MIFRGAHPSTPLSSAALRGPRGACRESISQAHSVFLPRSFPPLLLLEPSYPPFPAALLSPPSGCPSLAPKVASSLPPCCCRVQERRHKFSKQTTPKAQPSPAWSLVYSLGLPLTGEVPRGPNREGLLGRAGRRRSRGHDPSPRLSAGS